jgi:hypothetical protein
MMFKLGAIGSFFIAGVAILLGLMTLNILTNNFGMAFASDLIFIMFIVSTMMFLVACVIKCIGYYGFFSAYGSSFGIVSLVIGVIAPLFLWIFTFMGINYHDRFYFNGGLYHIEMQVWLGHLFVGVMLILMGISFILVRDFTNLSGASVAAGTLLIFAGALFIAGLGLYAVAWFILAAGEIAAGMVFAFARLPAANPPSPPVEIGRPSTFPQWEH